LSESTQHASERTRKAAGVVGIQSRYKTASHPDVIEARREHAASKLEDAIEQVVATAPPLTESQKARLIGLLAGAA
jgi:hypothetical protein